MFVVMKVALAAFASAFLICSGCGRERAALPEKLPAVAVRVAPVTKNSRTAGEDVVGTVRAKLQSVIEAKVSGRIETLAVVPGQQVKAGDLLAQLDAREIQARLDQARAVQDQAARDLERARKLFEQKITSQAEFDAVESKQRVAAAAAAEAETALTYAKIVAPFDGVVTRKLADVGDLAAPGKPIVEMEDPTALRFEAGVPEALSGAIHVGDKLPVRIGSAELSGTVAEMAPVADPNSRTFLVKLDLPQNEALRSGQFGRVIVPTGKADALWVPASAVITRGQMEIVFVATNDHAQLRLVRAGKRNAQEVEMLAGVSAGENVVVTGAEQLRDGQPITTES